MGDVTITVLRDTGCDGVIIRTDLVDTSHLTGRNQKLVLMDRSIMEVPVARCFMIPLCLQESFMSAIWLSEIFLEYTLTF